MFKVTKKDLMGRIGILAAKNGKVETPAFLPVINPVIQDITAEQLKRDFGASAIMTNAYIIYRRLKDMAISKKVHGLLSFDGVVMTDSGGYQQLEYGDVEVSPEDIVIFQEAIGSDIGVPLDIPTGLASKDDAAKTVEKTLSNIRASLRYMKENSSVIWAAPIQGGVHTDILAYCAKELRDMDFPMYALGSPTELMETYMFDKLFTMIVTARLSIGFEKPLHLFGAGHPMLFPFIVALGCDMFDSASYYLYAKDERYMTPNGTVRIEKLEYLPCYCKVCSEITVKELKSLNKEERVKIVAMHNLYVCFSEMKIVKQAIHEGKLFELLELKSRAHPSIYGAFKLLMDDKNLIKIMESHTPISKHRGLFLYDKLSLKRPEFTRAVRMLKERCILSSEEAILIPSRGPKSCKKVVSRLGYDGKKAILLYGAPYGVIPEALSSTYPFPHMEFSYSALSELKEDILKALKEYVEKAGYKRVTIILSRSPTLREHAKTIADALLSMGVHVTTVET